MFRLEKVFQNDDSAFILFNNFSKSVLLILLSHTFVVLNYNSIFELTNYQIFKNSNYFLYTVILSVTFFFSSIFFNDSKYYRSNFISFLRKDIINLFFSSIFTLAILFVISLEFIIEKKIIYLMILQIIVLFLIKIYFDNLYQNLIDKNIIQKNILLIGSYEEIKQILSKKFDKIFVYKCCMITDISKLNEKLVKSEIKFPIFKTNDDFRSILEYHSLGQIWVLNGDKDKQKILLKILKYSVDTLNINLKESLNIKGKKLLGNKYNFEFYEMSRFYGINLFLKILIDKILSIIFLILASPLLIISILGIYIEDGSPVIFTQNRTGWDGRRFKIFKLRTLKKAGFDKTLQVTKNDQRLLKLGRVIRRYSIDEIPQFYNVLIGDMSIVGPRPHMVEHDIHYSSLFYNFLKRHKCNPGITGWAQVNGLRGATPKPEIMERRMEFDLWYLNNWTVWLDIYIIFKTFYAIIKYKGD